MLDSKPFKATKMCFIIMVCVSLYFDLPNKKLTDQENNANFILRILTFIFFLLETIATIGFYGLVRNQYSYMKRSYLSVLNFIILAVELIYLTPLSSFYIMRRISRIRVFRLLFAIELRYRCYWDMRVMVRALIVFATKFLQLLLISSIIYFIFRGTDQNIALVIISYLYQVIAVLPLVTFIAPKALPAFYYKVFKKQKRTFRTKANNNATLTAMIRSISARNL